MLRIGLISDTHGLLRAEALEFLRGCDRILHGGDIGDGAILDSLAAIAPVTAVRGNNDVGPWAENIPEAVTLHFEKVGVHVIHDIAGFDMAAAHQELKVVVSGHSHKPSIRAKDGILFVNPGSAGRRRFKLPVSVGELLIDGALVTPRIVELPT